MKYQITLTITHYGDVSEDDHVNSLKDDIEQAVKDNWFLLSSQVDVRPVDSQEGK